MKDKIDALEKLVKTACKRVHQLETENKDLRLQVKAVSGEYQILMKNREKLQKMENWKKQVGEKLRKIKDKIDRAVSRAGAEKPPVLFEGKDEQKI